MTIFVQLLLASVVATLTFLIAFAGIQVFHILHEIRLSLQKMNRILDNTRTLSETAARPITAVNDFFSEVKGLVDVTQDKIIETTPDRPIQTVSKRFFHRSGQLLRPS